MIEHIRGALSSKAPAMAVVEAAGVGYALDIPLSTFQTLPEAGREVTLLTHFHVREDTHRLYGFATQAERELFRVLITVSQIGPKVALNVLSRISVADLVEAVGRGDTARLKAVPGIGQKTAERLVVELRGKLTHVGVSRAAGAPDAAPGGVAGGVRQETSEALLALGYNEAQVSRALQRTADVVAADAPIEEWIRKALQVM